MSMSNDEAIFILQETLNDIEPLSYGTAKLTQIALRKEAMRTAIVALRSQQEWIPCEERVPEDDTLMLVNYYDPRENAGEIWIGWHEMDNVWYIDGSAHSREDGNEVIAWQPLPEPYRGGNAE